MVRVCLQLCSDNQETATRSASATLHQGSPYGCSVPQGRSWAPSRRVRRTGSRATGRAVGMHLAGADDRMGPAETSQLCGAGWQPAPRLPLFPQPPSLPCRQLPAQECTRIRHTPPARQAGSCGLLKPSRAGSCPPGLLCRRRCHWALTQGWDAPASSLTCPGAR